MSICRELASGMLHSFSILADVLLRNSRFRCSLPNSKARDGLLIGELYFVKLFPYEIRSTKMIALIASAGWPTSLISLFTLKSRAGLIAVDELLPTSCPYAESIVGRELHIPEAPTAGRRFRAPALSGQRSASRSINPTIQYGLSACALGPARCGRVRTSSSGPS